MSAAAKLFGYGIGGIYVILGTVGFAWTSFSGWLVADTGSYLIWFRLNPTHNLVHLAIGAFLMWAGTEPEPVARLGVALVGVLYLGAGIAGFWLAGTPDWNVLAFNFADNLLHLGTGASALAVAAFSVGRTGRVSVRVPREAR